MGKNNIFQHKKVPIQYCLIALVCAQYYNYEGNIYRVVDIWKKVLFVFQFGTRKSNKIGLSRKNIKSLIIIICKFSCIHRHFIIVFSLEIWKLIPGASNFVVNKEACQSTLLCWAKSLLFSSSLMSSPKEYCC